MTGQKTLYLKLERRVETQKTVIRLGDLGKLVCADPGSLKAAKDMKICGFSGKRQERMATGERQQRQRSCTTSLYKGALNGTRVVRIPSASLQPHYRSPKR